MGRKKRIRPNDAYRFREWLHHEWDRGNAPGGITRSKWVEETMHSWANFDPPRWPNKAREPYDGERECPDCDGSGFYKSKGNIPRCSCPRCQGYGVVPECFSTFDGD